MRKKLTKEEINSRIPVEGISIIGEYTGCKITTEFTCSKGHIWKARPSGVLNGSGCPSCSIKANLSKEDVNLKLADRGITIIGPYITNKIKTDFVCSYGHIWTARPDSVMTHRGCPHCADHGFNPGKSAWEYVFTRDGYLKYGITNNLARRLRQHRYYGEIVLIHSRYHEVGQLALDWENNIKRTHGGRYATKEQCPDGYTETLPLSLLANLTINNSD